jgi:hypothetical protein
MSAGGGGGAVAKYFLRRLEPGDVLLSTDPNSAWSHTIRIGTSGSFSHAAIFSAEPFFVESHDQYGVTIFSNDRFGIADKKNVSIRRLNSGATAIAQKAGRAAEFYREQGYWLPGALRSKFRIGAESKKGALFCSQLVAKAYEDAGFELCPGIRPEHVTPADIERSPLLSPVDELVIAELPAQDRRTDLLDSDSQVSLLQKETERRAEIAAEIRDYMARYAYPIAPTLDDLIIEIVQDQDKTRQQNADSWIAEVLERHRFTEIPDRLRADVVPSARDTINGVPFSELTKEQLRSSIAKHREYLERWDIGERRNMNDEIEKLQIFKAEKNLRLFDYFIDYQKGRLRGMERDIAKISETINDLEAALSQR